MKLFKRVLNKDTKEQKGVAALTLVSVLTVVFMMLGIAIARTNLVKFETVQLLKDTRRSYYMAETGIEDTLIQIYEDIHYGGNPTGEETPIGTYFSSVESLDDDYNITGWGLNGKTRRELKLNVVLNFEVALVTTKAIFMADTFSMKGVGSRIQGDTWTNDDFVIENDAIVEGNVSAAGKGSMAVNWVWDGVVGGDPAIQGGQIIDNPETAAQVEGNVLAFDSVKVSGSGAYVQGDVICNGTVDVINDGLVDGTITQDAGVEWQEIPVPNFNFDQYREEALAKGTFFNNQLQFEVYMESLEEDGEIHFPEDLYYVENGDVKIDYDLTVYMTGLLVVQDNLYIYSEWHHNNANDLPALAAGKDMQLVTYQTRQAGPINISGIIYAGKVIYMKRLWPSDQLYIDGAAWAGDDIFIEENSFIKYNEDVASDVLGFDFVSGLSDLQINSWEEIL